MPRRHHKLPRRRPRSRRNPASHATCQVIFSSVENIMFPTSSHARLKNLLPDVLILHGKAWELGADLAECSASPILMQMSQSFFSFKNGQYPSSRIIMVFSSPSLMFEVILFSQLSAQTAVVHPSYPHRCRSPSHRQQLSLH